MVTTTQHVAGLDDAVERFAARPAVTAGERTLSYADLGRQAAALAGGYRQLGLQPGQRIVCQLPTGPEFLVALTAAWAIGAVHVGAPHDATGAELARLVARTGASALLYQPPGDAAEPLAAAHTVADAHPGLRLVTHAAPPGPYPSLTELLDAPPVPSLAPAIGDHDEVVVFLTSGSTGEPKAAVDTPAALWAKVAHFVDALAAGPDDVHLHALPLSHAFGLKLALGALASGGHLVTMPRFSPARALELATAHAATVLPATPTHLRLLLDHLDPGGHDLAALRMVATAAAPLSPDLAGRVTARLGAGIFHVYGCSEGFLVTTTDHDDVAAGSAGRTVFTGPPGTPPDGRLAVVEPGTDRPVTTGEVGELVFGARAPVRYLDTPDAATDGTYRSGDLGRVDAHGRVFVVGRVGDLVNRGGHKIAPGEIEAVLTRHPGVADCAVAPLPDRVLGEAVCACVVPAADTAPDLAAVRAFLSDHLARHKLPDALWVTDALPRTRLGKIDRGVLSGLVGQAPVTRWRA